MNIEKKQEGLKRAFEKNIAITEETIQKHKTGIEEEHQLISAAQGKIVLHNQAIEALEAEKEKLVKEYREFIETID
jgi:capsid protein